MNYTIRYTNGTVDAGYDTYASAVEAVHYAVGPCAVVGHDGDIRGGGERTLCWSCERDAIDDDGARAVCSIWREGGAS